MVWIRSALARSAGCISAIFASRSLSPSAWFALASRLRSFIAARSSAVKVLRAGFFVPLVAVLVSAIVNLLSVLDQAEDIAIGIGEAGHQAAAADVARRVLHGGPGRGHLGQLGLDVGHV